MSETEEGKNNLDEAHKNQKKAGAAENNPNNPETTGPAENLREEATEMVDEDKDEEEPV
jgi:hypothetical protein